jgi:hypothetical protein
MSRLAAVCLIVVAVATGCFGGEIAQPTTTSARPVSAAVVKKVQSEILSGQPGGPGTLRWAGVRCSIIQGGTIARCTGRLTTNTNPVGQALPPFEFRIDSTGRLVNAVCKLNGRINPACWK